MYDRNIKFTKSVVIGGDNIFESYEMFGILDYKLKDLGFTLIYNYDELSYTKICKSGLDEFDAIVVDIYKDKLCVRGIKEMDKATRRYTSFFENENVTLEDLSKALDKAMAQLMGD